LRNGGNHGRKRRRGIGESHVAAGKDESAHARRVQSQSLETTVPNALVAGKYHPASNAGERQPGPILYAFGKVACQPFDLRSGG
jgi:hypothetical protein